MLIILVRYQRVANTGDVPFSFAPKGGGVNHAKQHRNPDKNDDTSNYKRASQEAVTYMVSPLFARILS